MTPQKDNQRGNIGNGLAVDWEDDLVLTIWQARNLLAEIETFRDMDEIFNRLAEVEDILLNLILRIVAKREALDDPAPFNRARLAVSVCSKHSDPRAEG